MTKVTISAALDQRRSIAGTGTSYSFLHRIIDCKHIVAIHRNTRNSVGDGAVRDLGDILMELLWHGNAVKIVFAYVDHR